MAAKKIYQMFTKSAIPELFKHYRVRLDATRYLAASQVFPMRINNHIVEDLIDWSNLPADPIFQLSFPQPEMVPENDMLKIVDLMQSAAPRTSIQKLAEAIRNTMNPHPANQKTENVPRSGGLELEGMQHKYKETVLFFPSEFTSVGSDQTFKSSACEQLRDYISSHSQVRDVLFTGGDPMVMSPDVLSKYIEPLISERAPRHLETIRIGSKSLAWWPYKYTTDDNAKDILGLFERVVKSGRQLAFQAHFSHPRELEHPAAQKAIQEIRMTGAQVRGQAPLIRHVNNSPRIWQYMWNLQTKLGVIPYYMFVERDTGASHYFSVPLAQAYNIFSEAYSGLVGTARTVRGPSMSASPGKVGVVGIETVKDEPVFLLKFWQARDPSWLHRVFFAKFDPDAAWLSDLKPAFGEKEFFFEAGYRKIVEQAQHSSSGQLLD